MSQKIIKIGNYIFVLTMVSHNQVTSAHFLFHDNYEKDMTKEEIEKGRKIQGQIFAGKYNHLIPDNINVGKETE